VRWFRASEPDFQARFDAFALERRGGSGAVDAAVAEIVDAVRAEGFAALARYTARFDGAVIDERSVAVTAEQIAEGAALCPEPVQDALRFAAERIAAYHERQRPADDRWTDGAGATLGWRWTPLDSVGLYVPGGRAAYPSSVLMNATPARVAGVARIAMVSPPGRLDPAVLAAAQIAGVTEIWRVGGAQAVAALAYGAGPIQPVDKIVGPGNAWVAAAKRRVFGQVGIDTPAGPSEIVVVADGLNDPAWIAADLLSQAEHDPAAQAVLITDDEGFAGRVCAEIDRLLGVLATGEAAGASWRDHGAVVLAPLDAAPGLVDRLAPEHVEFATAEPEVLAEQVRHAGAIFLGRHAPEAVGDYVAGSNHVLPTSGAARFASGLSIYDFLKRTSLLSFGSAGMAALGPATVVLAEAEGLPAHALSARLRLEGRP
jgi:histidinol dehydrogenase